MMHEIADAAARELVAILTAQLEQHREMLGELERKKTAIRTADLPAIEALCNSEHELLRSIHELEARRLEIVGELTGRLAPDAERPLSADEIASRCTTEASGDLRGAAQQLREIVERVKAESGIVRVAAESLANHLAGVAATVQAALGRAVVYSANGRMDSGGLHQRHAVDMTS